MDENQMSEETRASMLSLITEMKVRYAAIAISALFISIIMLIRGEALKGNKILFFPLLILAALGILGWFRVKFLADHDRYYFVVGACTNKEMMSKNIIRRANSDTNWSYQFTIFNDYDPEMPKDGIVIYIDGQPKDKFRVGQAYNMLFLQNGNELSASNLVAFKKVGFKKQP